MDQIEQCKENLKLKESKFTTQGTRIRMKPKIKRK